MLQAVEFLTQEPSVARRSAPRDVKDADGYFEVTVQEHPIKIRDR